MRHERPWEAEARAGLAGTSAGDSAGAALSDRQLEAGWRALEAAATLPSQTFDFHAALADTLLAGRVRELVTVREGEDIVAILPLCRRRRWLAGWHAAGPRQVYEPVDALCRDEAAVQALADRLTRLSRPLKFDRIPAGSPLVPALKARMKGRGLFVIRPAQASPRIDFATGPRDPEQRFNSGRRSDFRRARRRAEAIGEVAFEMQSPAPGEFDALFEQAVAIEDSGWKAEAGTALASDAAKAGFFGRFLKGASRDGRCRIAFMRIDGQPVATQLAVEFQRRYWLFKIGFDRRFARCSPGNLLLLFAMADAATRGLAGVELLGEVEPWIAEAWTQEAMPCLRLQTYPFNLRGLATLAGEALIWAWKRLPFAGRPA